MYVKIVDGATLRISATSFVLRPLTSFLFFKLHLLLSFSTVIAPLLILKVLPYIVEISIEMEVDTHSHIEHPFTYSFI